MRGLLLMVAALTVMPYINARAQTMAHQGWAGSGYTVEPWWKGAVFYEIDPLTFPAAKGETATGDLRGVVSHLDYLQALGVDAIVLPPVDLKNANTSRYRTYLRPGNEEEFGLLIDEANRRKIRVVVDLPLLADQSDEELACAARFLLSRGAAALRLTPDPHASRQSLSVFERAERLRALRMLCASYGGERILLWDLPDASSAEAPTGEVSFAVHRPDPRRALHRGVHPPSHTSLLHAAEVDINRFGPQMAVDRRLSLLSPGSGDEVRGSLLGLERESRRQAPEPVLADFISDHAGTLAEDAAHSHDPALAKVVATVLLASRGGALLRAGQELGIQKIAVVAGANPFNAQIAAEDGSQDSLLNWYRKLNLLRHSSAALRNGTMEMLETANPDVVAWIRRARVSGAATPTTIVVCNPAPHANRISLRAELQRLGLGLGDGHLHRLLASDLGAGSAESVDNLDLQADGAYVGELRPQRGLETVVLPPRRSRKRSR